MLTTLLMRIAISSKAAWSILRLSRTVQPAATCVLTMLIESITFVGLCADISSASIWCFCGLAPGDMVVCVWWYQGHPSPKKPAGGMRYATQRAPGLVSCAGTRAQRCTRHSTWHCLPIP